MAGPARKAIVWPWTTWRRGDAIGVAVCLVLLIGFLLATVAHPYFPFFGASGFGPDWECTRLPKTEPVCVKRVPAPPQR